MLYGAERLRQNHLFDVREVADEFGPVLVFRCYQIDRLRAHVLKVGDYAANEVVFEVYELLVAGVVEVREKVAVAAKFCGFLVSSPPGT